MSKLKIAMFVTVLAAAGAASWWLLTKPAAESGRGYDAVYLDNGLVLYGRLEGFGGPFPVLREVYLSKSGLNLGTKQILNALGKRSYEPHKPAYTVLNARHILQVEPVRDGSSIADSIIELRGR